MDAIVNKKHLKLLQRGEKRVISWWFEKYCDSLYTFVYYRTGGDGEVAGDIVEETFDKAYHLLDKFDPDQNSMLAWLTLIATSCIRIINDSEEHGNKLSLFGIKKDLYDSYIRIATEALPEEVLEQRQTVELVQMTLANLSADHKSLLTEYYYNLKPAREISVLAGMDEQQIRTMLYKARKAFKDTFLELSKSLRASAGFDEDSYGQQ